jgi:hypothetical protein
LTVIEIVIFNEKPFQYKKDFSALDKSSVEKAQKHAISPIFPAVRRFVASVLSLSA